MKNRDLRSYLDLLKGIVVQAGNPGRSMAFRLTNHGSRERATPWFQITPALAHALTSGRLSGGTEKEFMNLVNQLRSHPLGARVLGHASALSVAAFETHVGSLRAAKQRDHSSNHRKSRKKREHRKPAAEVQHCAGGIPVMSHSEHAGESYRPGQVLEIPSSILARRSPTAGPRRFLVLSDGPEIVAVVDLHWNALGRRHALEDLKRARAMTKRHLRDQAQLYRLWASECRATRDEISTLLVCLHPANTPLSELIEYQRQLDAAAFWAREFGRLAVECETAVRKLHAQPLAA